MFNLCNFISKNKNIKLNNKEIKEIKEKDKEKPKDYIIIDRDFENNECVICLEGMVINNKVKILRCGHIYHYKCINDWIKKKGEINCPLCSN